MSLAYCDGCGVEHMTDQDSAPFYCKGCSVVYNITAEGDLDYRRIPDKEEEVDSTAATIFKNHNYCCVRRAIREYVADRKAREDKWSVRERSFTKFKVEKNLPDNEPVLAAIGREAKNCGMNTYELMKLLAEHDRVDEAILELVAISRELGYMAYDALDNDNMEASLGITPTNYDEYLKKYDMSICLEKDDPLADLPF